MRVGLVGCGRIGALGDERMRQYFAGSIYLPYSHASAIQAAGGELAAVCDSNLAAAADAASRFGVQHYYSDFREMLAVESLDLISIATRTAARGEIIMGAVQAGIKGIYCEKPLSTSLESADRLAAALAPNGVLFVYGGQRRYMPVFASVRDHVRDGSIGVLTDVVLHWSAGALLWRHPHSVDIAAFLASDARVTSVSADLQTEAEAIDGLTIDCDPIVRAGRIRYASGVTATIVVDDANVVELRGGDGTITVEQDGLKIFLHRAGKSQDVSVVPETSGTVIAMRGLMAAVRGQATPKYDIQMAVANQEVLFGWLESGLAGGRAIDLPLTRKGYVVTGRTQDKFV